MTDLDKIDRKILSILQGDGRIANVELAERIGLSPTSIGERLKRLQREALELIRRPGLRGRCGATRDKMR
jgi:DNA-binding Lrp family transcriptional regulator